MPASSLPRYPGARAAQKASSASAAAAASPGLAAFTCSRSAASLEFRAAAKQATTKRMAPFLSHYIFCLSEGGLKAYSYKLKT